MNKNSVVIRHYSEADYPDVLSLWQATGMGGAERGDNNAVIEKTLEQGGAFIVLEAAENGKVVGTAWITNDGRRLYLHHFGILPQFQGQGLSKILLEAVLDFAKKTGLQIKLEVHRDNSKAVALYEKYGFKQLGDYMVYIIRNY